MKADYENPVSDLSSLEIEYSEEGGEACCNASLDMAVAEWDTQQQSFSIGIRKAWLMLDVEGFKVIMSTRYGLTPQKVVTEYVETEEVRSGSGYKSSDSSEGKLVLPAGAGATLASKFEDEIHQETAYSVSTTAVVRNVAPHGANTWILKGSNGGPLEGNIIPSVKLASLSQTDANRRHITARVVVRQKDLEYSVFENKSVGTKLSARYFPQTTRNRLAAIFASKCIAGKAQSETEYSGKFSISSARLDDEGV